MKWDTFIIYKQSYDPLNGLVGPQFVAGTHQRSFNTIKTFMQDYFKENAGEKTNQGDLTVMKSLNNLDHMVICHNTK